MYQDALQQKNEIELELNKKIKELAKLNLLVNDDSKEYIHNLEKQFDDSEGELEYLIGFLYLEGQLVDKDSDKAISLFKKAHDKNFWYATVALAIMNYFGYCIDKNIDATDQYISALIEYEIDDDGIYEFKDAYELFELIKSAAGINNREAMKMIADFYIAAGDDADCIPSSWKACRDEYYYQEALLWLEDLSNEGDKTAAWRMYKILTDCFEFADQYLIYTCLKTAALYDKYPEAVDEYNYLKDESKLDDIIEYEKMMNESN